MLPQIRFGFLARFEGNVILDEIQRVPELLSYIQTIVDTRQRNGQFVLTGSLPPLIPIDGNCRVRVDAGPFGVVEAGFEE